jgi:uncharacterized membrane protein (UPF0127 family)
MRTGEDALVIREAAGFRERLLGLAFRREAPHGEALLIPRCRSVHTFGMRFPLDIAFLDEHGSVMRLERSVPPRRVLYCRGASAVLETPSC